MLYYGGGMYIPDNCKVFNLNSLREGYQSFRFLIPPNSLGNFVDRDFDILYYNYIFNNDNVFTEFFGIIYELYINNDIFILVDENMDWSENIAESLWKVIQQRYGYNAIRINNSDDYIYAVNSSYSLPQFNPYWGIYNLDLDKQRYSEIIEAARLQAGGKLIYVDE